MIEIERFWQKTRVDGVCLIWIGCVHKIVDRRPLLDLLFSAQSTLDPDDQPNVDPRLTRRSLWMRENSTYEVDVTASVGATQKLQRWLVEHTADHRLTAWIFLEGIIRSAPM